MYDLETMAPTEKQQKVQVYEDNWLRGIEGVKRADKKRLGGLRVDDGVKESFKKKWMRSRLKWATLAKRADAQKLEGNGRRGKLRWEDSFKRDLKRGKDKRRTRAKYRRKWRLLIEKVLREK